MAMGSCCWIGDCGAINQVLDLIGLGLRCVIRLQALLSRPFDLWWVAISYASLDHFHV
ncbi:hypothetical protein LguiA_003601 [Lonicera macranthoides]